MARARRRAFVSGHPRGRRAKPARTAEGCSHRGSRQVGDYGDGFGEPPCHSRRAGKRDGRSRLGGREVLRSRRRGCACATGRWPRHVVSPTRATAPSLSRVAGLRARRSARLGKESRRRRASPTDAEKVQSDGWQSSGRSAIPTVVTGFIAAAVAARARGVAVSVRGIEGRGARRRHRGDGRNRRRRPAEAVTCGAVEIGGGLSMGNMSRATQRIWARMGSFPRAVPEWLTRWRAGWSFALPPALGESRRNPAMPGAASATRSARQAGGSKTRRAGSTSAHRLPRGQADVRATRRPAAATTCLYADLVRSPPRPRLIGATLPTTRNLLVPLTQFLLSSQDAARR